jgi:site-specific DNA-methyltransferase (adenine-specific)
MLTEYKNTTTIKPLFIHGDAKEIICNFEDQSIDMVMTSPPYWGHRKYSGGGIGLEETWQEYINSLLEIFAEIYRVLKDSGSCWLNIGDAYDKKCLIGIPWRLALAMVDEQGWIMRNDIIWNKLKGGMDNSKDKIANTHEYLFHFVKKAQGYYYDIDSIRSNPRKTRVVNGAVVSATGVSGIRYKRQIELSTALTEQEKNNAMRVLEDILLQIKNGELSDFRMVIRGQQRATHSDSSKVSGRARELQEKGFYILRYHPNGTKPDDVWDIIPEDTKRTHNHYAAYPQDLCKIPILSTAPIDGIILDPFTGTGTTNLVAFELGRKSIGIDISKEYIDISTERCRKLL